VNSPGLSAILTDPHAERWQAAKALVSLRASKAHLALDRTTQAGKYP
jgi:hypothetical protein